LKAPAFDFSKLPYLLLVQLNTTTVPDDQYQVGFEVLLLAKTSHPHLPLPFGLFFTNREPSFTAPDETGRLWITIRTGVARCHQPHRIRTPQRAAWATPSCLRDIERLLISDHQRALFLHCVGDICSPVLPAARPDGEPICKYV
jgi:hypothetical protein